jgi:hypothetical protein
MDNLASFTVATYQCEPAAKVSGNPEEHATQSSETQSAMSPHEPNEPQLHPVPPDSGAQTEPAKPSSVHESSNQDRKPAEMNGLGDRKEPAGADAPSNASIHDWLSQRMTHLQREQQTRWQRLLRLLTRR